jgi:hypothetical protein
MVYDKNHTERIDIELSKKCNDLAVNSGEYNPFGKKETTYIDQSGKVITEKDPYGNLE